MTTVPVILDTDIGDDCDDTWALAMLLRLPELDLKLVTTATGDTTYRAKIVARLLQTAGSDDKPIGIGIPNTGRPTPPRQTGWVEGYTLDRYPGLIHPDGVQAIIDTIMMSSEPITLIAIGPLSNIAEALRREPRIADRTKLVGMHGSFNWHISTNLSLSLKPGGRPEWNVVCDIPAAQAVFAAPWLSVTITPLDTCAHIVLDGERYQRLLASHDPLARAVIENYRIWAATHSEGCDPATRSSVLFDCVAIHLAHTTRWLQMRRLNVLVDTTGNTVESAQGRPVHVAMEWENKEAFEDALLNCLLDPSAHFQNHQG